jgi:hypothetical protein
MKKGAHGPEPTHFLNVDLDIYSHKDLQPLVTAMGRKVIVLYVGRQKRTYSAHLELYRMAKTADSTIRSFCALVRALAPRERKLWDQAKVRDFNIGVQSGMQPRSYELALQEETVKSASELGARIVFTVYAPHNPTGTGE